MIYVQTYRYQRNAILNTFATSSAPSPELLLAGFNIRFKGSSRSSARRIALLSIAVPLWKSVDIAHLTEKMLIRDLLLLGNPVGLKGVKSGLSMITFVSLIGENVMLDNLPQPPP